jgi:predicted HAD superfamily Cof-like phosphohydrolase
MIPQTTRVKNFMQFFNQKTPDCPTQIDESTAKLRAALIFEECLELLVKGLGLKICIQDIYGQSVCINEEVLPMVLTKVSFVKEKEVDLVQVGDGISDMFVVVEGTGIACGLDSEPLINEVLDSNDTKAWKEEDLAIAKEKFPYAKVEHYSGSLYRIFREDGKVIKSPNYKIARIAELIEAQKQ